MNAYADSHIGLVRTNNEDSSRIIELPKKMNLLIVADGMGGHNKGEVASGMAVECIKKYFDKNKDLIEDYLEATDNEKALGDRILQDMKEAINYANSEITKLSTTDEYKMMGTTVVIAAIYRGFLYVANVGDSRWYILHGGKNASLEQITRDNSLVQQLVDLGEITHEEAETHPQRNIITRAVGIDSKVETDVYRVQVSMNDILMLCSDGLTSMVSDKEIEKILKDSTTIEAKTKKLICKALKNGGRDNITVICAEIDEVEHG